MNLNLIRNKTLTSDILFLFISVIPFCISSVVNSGHQIAKLTMTHAMERPHIYGDSDYQEQLNKQGKT